MDRPSLSSAHRARTGCIYDTYALHTMGAALHPYSRRTQLRMPPPGAAQRTPRGRGRYPAVRSPLRAGAGQGGSGGGGGGAALGGAAASLIARINNLSRLVSASNRQTSDVVFRRQQRPDQRSGPEGTIEDVNPHRGSEAPRPWDSGVPGRTEGFGAPTVRRCAPTPN